MAGEETIMVADGGVVGFRARRRGRELSAPLALQEMEAISRAFHLPFYFDRPVIRFRASSPNPANAAPNRPKEAGSGETAEINTSPFPLFSPAMRI